MAEGGGLENRCTVKCAGGSNPSLSAIKKQLIILVVFLCGRSAKDAYLVIRLTII